MSKYDFDVAVAFGTQTDDTTYNSTLDAISATLSGDRNPGGADSDDGLILGDSQSGVKESGLNITYGRSARLKSFVSGSFTRPISDLLKAEVRTFTFAFPFCNHRAFPQATPADADFVPHAGLDALLEGAGLVGAAWGSGVGHSYKFNATYPQPISALIYGSGLRLELLSCRVSDLSIVYTPGDIPIATATIEVGSIKDPSAKGFSASSLPTLDYGEQATVSAPVVESVGFGWNATRGFSSLTLSIRPTTETIPDSNATDGEVKEITDREVLIEGTLYGDDASENEVYAMDQILATASSDLDQLSFQVGTDATTSSIACLAHQVIVPEPEIDQSALANLGTKAADTVSLRARNDTAHEELEIIFR